MSEKQREPGELRLRTQQMYEASCEITGYAGHCPFHPVVVYMQRMTARRASLYTAFAPHFAAENMTGPSGCRNRILLFPCEL